jgi:hypothetical protein
MISLEISLALGEFEVEITLSQGIAANALPTLSCGLFTYFHALVMHSSSIPVESFHPLLALRQEHFLDTRTIQAGEGFK